MLKAGRTVAQVAHDLQISDQTIYTWRRQSLVDAGQEPGLTSVEKAELSSARRRIAELETELAIHQRATELLKEVVRPKARFAAIAAMAQDGLPIQTACRILGVSESGLHAWRGRAPSARSVRHAWLTDLIRQAHVASNGVYGSRRVRAELMLGHGITVSHGAVEMLMKRAGITGLPGRKHRRPRPDTATASDLVDRDFVRTAPNQLWITDIERHEALLNREGV